MARRGRAFAHESLANGWRRRTVGWRECGNPGKALAETDHISKSHPALLTSRAAAMCDLERWEDAQKILARALAIEASGEAFAVVARIKKFRPDLYPNSN